MTSVEYGLGGERIIRMDGRDSRFVLAAAPDDMREAIRRTGHIRHLDRLARRGDRFPGLRASSAGAAGYIINTGTSAIALSAATAKTIWYVNTGANRNFSITEIAVGFDGVTASAVPGLVELVYGTKATNSTPGTGSTTFTPVQGRGWAVQTAAAAAANNCTSEPTVLVVHRTWLLTPNGGLLVVQFPLGREPVGHNIASTSGLQIGLRVNAPAAVNVRSFGEIEE